tara:strand:+ start:483 stop:839 length:357 start_codon:yes stop_codon:yes gene_type:complete
MDIINALSGIIAVVYFGVLLLTFVSLWRVHTKAGRPGWACLIPIYNLVVLVQIASRPLWWVILFFIPCIGIPFYVITMVDIAKAFGKGTGFGIGLLILAPIFLPILAFGSAEYKGLTR